jgi:hypothetical protein
LLNTS